MIVIGQTKFRPRPIIRSWAIVDKREKSLSYNLVGCITINWAVLILYINVTRVVNSAILYWYKQYCQYFFSVLPEYCNTFSKIGIGIGNTFLNIGNWFLLIPIVNTFMEQNGRIHTILSPIRITNLSYSFGGVLVYWTMNSEHWL